MGPKQWRGSVAAGVAALLLGALTPAEARVGVTGAVVPETDAIPSGGSLAPLVLGADIEFMEHILTNEGGQAQILFLDRSTLSVGPNADVVIDKFVYSPETDDGSLAIKATKGILRFVGGALSKHEDAVKIETPTAIIGIRGGIALIEIAANGATRATFIFGEELTVSSLNGATTHIRRPGFAAVAEVGAPKPSAPVKASVEQIATILTKLAPPPPVKSAAPSVSIPSNAPPGAKSAILSAGPGSTAKPGAPTGALASANLAPPPGAKPLVSITKPVSAVGLSPLALPVVKKPPEAKAVTVAKKKK